jgi:hypothetical protein
MTIEQYGFKGSIDNFGFLRDLNQFTTVSIDLGMKFAPYAMSVDDFCVPLANVINDRALNGIWRTRRMFADNVLCHGGPYCGTIEYTGVHQTPVGIVSRIRIYPQYVHYFKAMLGKDFVSFPTNHFNLRKRVAQLTKLVELLGNASYNDKAEMSKLRVEITVTAFGSIDVPLVDDQLRSTRAAVLDNLKIVLVPVDSIRDHLQDMLRRARLRGLTRARNDKPLPITKVRKT